MKESALYLRIEESDMITMTYVFGVKTSMNAPNAELRTSILLKWDWNLLQNQGIMSSWRPLQKSRKHIASWINATVLKKYAYLRQKFLPLLFSLLTALVCVHHFMPNSLFICPILYLVKSSSILSQDVIKPHGLKFVQKEMRHVVAKFSLLISPRQTKMHFKKQYCIVSPNFKSNHTSSS